MAHIVHCRLCKEKIDIDTSRDWVRPSQNWYYHVKCYEDWVKKKGERSVKANRAQDEWYALLKDYLWRDIKLPGLDFAKVNSQWNNFLKTKSFTPKGIYFAVVYFYEVLKGDINKAQGGIGIVSNIYNESATYWTKLENKRTGTLEDVVKQIALRTSRPVLKIGGATNSNKKVNRAKYNLDEVEDD